MTKRILIALLAINVVLLTFAAPLRAQDRQIGNTQSTGNKRPETRSIQPLDAEGAEKLRGELLTAFSESEALLKFMAGFSFTRQSRPMEDYETVIGELSKERTRVEQLSVVDVLAQAPNWPDSESLNRVIELSRQVRNDQKLKEAIQQAERYSQTGLQAGDATSLRGANSREVISAPAYIPPICNHDNPEDYPSGTDLAISKAVALALHAVASAMPDDIGFLFSIPNIIKIVIVIAAGVVDQVSNALEAVAADAKYCEGMRLYIEDKLANESGLTTILFTNDFYLTFTVKAVRATLTRATSLGITTNCASTRLTEALTYFNGSDVFNGSSGADRVTAFKKLRQAFLNIGAPACVP